MPSSSKKQHQFMEAIAHGWKPDKKKAPSKAVAQDFVEADKEVGAFKSKVKARSDRVKKDRGKQ